MKNTLGVGAALLAAMLLGSCGGSDLNSGTPGPNQAAANIAVPNVTAGTNFSFDLGVVIDGKYYLTDRNNKAVDVVDVSSLQLTQIKGTGALVFTSVSTVGNAKSDTYEFISFTHTGQIYVGYLDGMKVVNAETDKITRILLAGGTRY